MRLEENWQKRLESIALVMAEAKKVLLLASFPDRETVETAIHFSRDLTLPPNVLEDILRNKHAEEAIRVFDSRVIFDE